MNIVVKRLYKEDNYTIGKLYIDNKYICDTIEDKERGLVDTMSELDIKNKKIYGQTAIPLGTYKIDMNTVSPKFKERSWAKPYGGKLPRLLGVKGFSGVLIHVGNTAKDSLGCLLVGENKSKGMVTNSTKTFHKLMEILQKAHNIGDDIWLNIV